MKKLYLTLLALAVATTWAISAHEIRQYNRLVDNTSVKQHTFINTCPAPVPVPQIPTGDQPLSITARQLIENPPTVYYPRPNEAC